MERAVASGVGAPQQEERDQPGDRDRSTMALEAESVARRFGRSWALRKVTLQVPAGSVVGLLGPNGSGKSTLLKVFAGVLQATRGRVRIFDRLLDSGNDEERAKVGLVSHQPLLYPDLTALENLRYAARMIGCDNDDGEARDLLGRVGLGDVPDGLLRTFSQGMAQRLGLARALIHDPPLLLLDEPYSALDPDGALMVDRMLTEGRGTRTAVVVTHQADRAVELCDRIVALRRGRVVFDGTPADYRLSAAAPREGVA